MSICLQFLKEYQLMQGQKQVTSVEWTLASDKMDKQSWEVCQIYTQSEVVAEEVLMDRDNLPLDRSTQHVTINL